MRYFNLSLLAFLAVFGGLTAQEEMTAANDSDTEVADQQKDQEKEAAPEQE